ncbi:hypothetical protein GGR54DRAFT_636071 [Hypoxylon sp. NC1633]|nr:hypothetical protein GGR54DRAFT_636071 [Hypoxylon sp. NC1633]
MDCLWSLLETIWASSLVFLIMFAFLPETSTPNLLLRRALRLRNLTDSSCLIGFALYAAYLFYVRLLIAAHGQLAQESQLITRNGGDVQADGGPSIFVHVPVSYPRYASSLFAYNNFFRSALRVREHPGFSRRVASILFWARA